jgi:ABC-2 type transport system permease protein
MTRASRSIISGLLNPIRLTGPLFDKELRVSSRRRRNYVLRSTYVVLMTVFVAAVWISVVQFEGTSAVQKAQMSVAGKAIVSTIAMFQFVAIQLIAVIMLSTSISDEIYNRTLGLLMTTPINSFQIVIGKLLSKLLQLILLVGVSVPLLAVVRVFGGVPWNYLLSSFCITLTAVIFAGSLSLYFSISNRRAYVVIIKTVFVLGLLYMFIPAVTGALSILMVGSFSAARAPIPIFSMLYSALILINPLAIMFANTTRMLSGGVSAGFIRLNWPLHCGVMLGISVLLLARCMQIVRRVALRQATGQIDPASNLPPLRKDRTASAHAGRLRDPHALIRRVRGLPIAWKDLRAPIIKGVDRRNSVTGFVAAVAALLITYVICARTACLDADSTHVCYALLFVIMGIIFSIVLAAASITSEKESQTWPILLATPMGDWHILLGKALAAFRRCLPVWILWGAHVLIFVITRYLHPIVFVHVVMLVAWLTVFLIGSALYFSARFKRTTSAVVASLVLAFALWVVIPASLGVLTAFFHKPYALNESALANPLVQAAVVTSGGTTPGRYHIPQDLAELNYDWPGSPGVRSAWATTVILLVNMLLYVLAGSLFAWRAKCRLRRGVF